MQVKCIVAAGAAASFPNHVVLNVGSIWSTSLLPWQSVSRGSAPSGEGIIPSGALAFQPRGTRMRPPEAGDPLTLQG